MTARNYSSANPAALGQYLTLERSGTVITHDTSCDNQRMALGLYPKSSGIWFFECTLFGEETLSSAGVSVGVARESASLAECVGDSAASFGYRSDGKLRDSGIDRASALQMVYGDVIGTLVDPSGKVTWYRNGVYQGELTLPTGHQWAIAVTVSNATTAYGTKVLLNAGQQAFQYPPPLVTNKGWYDATASFGALRVADRPALLAGTRYHGLVSARQSSLSVTQALSFWPWDGQPAQSRASLALDNASGYADSLFAGDARDAKVDVRDPDTGAPLISMLVDGAQSQGDGGALIRLRDRMADTQTALQRRLIKPGADPSSAFKPWPLVLGAVYSIEPPVLDTAAQDYAVNDGPLAAIGTVRDKGDPLDYSAGDYTYEATTGILTLHNGQAQGRITLDMSSVGGTQQTPPTDLMDSSHYGGGDFTDPFKWTLGGDGAANSSISGGKLTLGDATWPDPAVRNNSTPISWAKHNSLTLQAGRTYRIVLELTKLGAAPNMGQPSYDVPARLTVISGGAEPSYYLIPWLSVTAKAYPHGGWRNYDHSPETVVGYVTPGSDVSLFIALTGSYEAGDQAIIESIEVNEIGLDDFDDDSLEPITLEAYMREVLETRAGWSSDDWSAADAAAIDAATGYAGIGLYAASDSNLTVYDALQLGAQAYCACLWIDAARTLRITRLTAPEDVPAALVDHEIGKADILDDPDITLDLAPNLSTQLGARKNWSPLNGSDLVTDGVALPGSGNPANTNLGIQGDVSFADDGWTWNVDISGKSLAWGNLTGVPASATRWPTWGEVTSKPTFGGMANVNDAPSDGTGYVRKDGAWAAEISGSYVDLSSNQTIGGTKTFIGSSNTFKDVSLPYTQMFISTGDNVCKTVFGAYTYAFFGSFTNHDLVIRTNNTERARVTAAGAFQIRNLSLPGTKSQYVRGDGSRATFPTNVSSFANDAGYATESWANGQFLKLTGGTLTGTLTGTTIQGTTIRETSDRRLKRDIHALTDQTSGIMQLTPVRYRRAATECVELGLIAQDVRRVYPEAVGEDSDGMLSLAYQRLIAPMLDVMQRQQRRIDALERKLEAMR